MKDREEMRMKEEVEMNGYFPAYSDDPIFWQKYSFSYCLWEIFENLLNYTG